MQTAGSVSLGNIVFLQQWGHQRQRQVSVQLNIRIFLPAVCMARTKGGWGRTEGGTGGISNRQLTPERSAARFDAHLHSGLQGGKRCAQRLAHLRRLQLLSDSPGAAAAQDRVFSPSLTFLTLPSGARPREREKGEFIIQIVRDIRTASPRSLTNNHVWHGRRLWMYWQSGSAQLTGLWTRF